ncbi:GLUG motif-containing protein, partial [Halomonas sp. ATBC28]|uniref:GLUG motif-containing protein n=1 Tax=Halomonas sp. ATBC28 TaxID=2545264 RepID=UPI001485E56F
MNRVYRVVWNRRRRVWQAAAENSGSHRGGGGTTAGTPRAILFAHDLRPLAAALLSVMPLAVQAGELPSGGTVVAGQASIARQGDTLTIDQSSHKAAVDWRRFSVGEGNTVRFRQPSAEAATLNRVTGDQVSSIRGAIDANGRVFLINPNGITFSPSARVDVGALVASTLDISTDDFMNGDYRFSGDSANAVINQGNIRTANGGLVAMIAARIVNTGTIDTPRGSTLMGAGSRVTLDLGGPVNIEVKEATLATLIEQGGAIRADGGRVYLTAKAAGELTASVINHSGITEARTLASGENGQIMLMGDMESGTLQVAGTLDASAPQGGDGGFIETSAAKVSIADEIHVTTRAADVPGNSGQTGEWLIDPSDFTVSAGDGGQTDSGIGAETLSASLAQTDATVQTAPSGNGNGDIFVNDAVSWSSGYTLTLDAYRDIEINATLDAAQGSGGKLALEYGQGSGNGQIGGRAAEYRVNAPVNLQAGNNFSTKLGSNGATIDYTVITALGAENSTTTTDLQGMAGDLDGHYALGANIDASATAGWNDGAGFAPMGDFFSRFTGTFDGLGHTLSDLTINREGTDYIGLFGRVDTSGTLRHIGLVDGSVTGSNLVGGLVGLNEGIITNAYATGAVSGDQDYVGGLVGSNRGSITNAYATGAVSGNLVVGGLAGSNSNNGTITNAYATGAVSGNGYVGGLVGYNIGTLTDAYWNTETTGQDSSSGGGTGLTTAQMFEASNLEGFDFDTVWGNSGDQTTPWLRGLAGNRVFNKNDLPSGMINATNRPDLYTALLDVDQLQAMQNDLAGRYLLGMDIDASATAGWNSEAGFAPIGDASSRFTGTFDGLGHTVSDLTINRPGTSFVGLFGYVGAGGTLRHIGLVDGSVKGSTIVGGLVGGNDNGTITHAYATGAVSGNQYVGGLVGFNQGSITSAYATGAVSGNQYVGGLVGFNSGSSITHAYATGAVSGNQLVGGLVGDNNGTLTDAYWNTETTGQDSSSGGGTGLTTAQMFEASNLEGFDFDTVWGNSGDQTTPWLRGLAGNRVFNKNDLPSGTINATNRPELYTALLNIDQLQAMQNDLAGRYLLGLDIDASATKDWNEGAGFDPVGDAFTHFTGTFDGLGHTLSDLTINRPNADQIGLFGYVDRGGTLRHIGLVDGSVTGRDIVGGLVGRNNGSIKRAYATGAVSGNGYIGGLVGYNPSGTITDAYATGATSGDQTVGGLVGINSSGTIANAYATGAVSGNDYVGGLVGINNSTIANAYATGAVSGNDSVGGLVGWNEGTITDAYWNTETTGQAISAGGGTGLTTAQMFEASNLEGFDFDTVWGNSDNQTTPWLRGLAGNRVFNKNDLPSGTIDATNRPDLYTALLNIDQLQAMQNDLAGRYLLGMDIDASATAGWNGGAGFAPVGNNNNRFTGTFDGLGHTLSDLTINRPGTDYIGLFGYVGAGGTLRHVGLVDGNVTGKDYVGGLVGWNQGSPITHAYATGAVSGNQYVGGLVGINNGTITHAYATGAVSGNQTVGGLVGSSNGTITHAYATGAVSGDQDYVGGLVGSNQGTITHAYATGAVSGNQNVGGLVGSKFSSNINNAYWNTETTGQAISAGGGTGLTTAQMFEASNLEGFDFDTVWGNSDNQTTPWLRGLAGNQVFNKNDLPSGTIDATNRPELYTALLNIDQLQAMQNDVAGHYLLGMDIDASATAGWNDGAGFAPIGVEPLGDSASSFTGIFDGLGHTVSDLTIDRPGTDHVGLFGFVGTGGTLGHIGLVDGNVTGKNYVGGLVGWNDGSISNAYATGAVSGDQTVGGLVGSNQGTITHAYATGTVSGQDAGGLVGRNFSGSITHAYATGAVSGQDAGGLVGNNHSGTITDAYWNTETTGQAISAGGGTGLTTAQMFEASNLEGFDFDTVWGNSDNQTTPWLRGLAGNQVFNKNDLPS